MIDNQTKEHVACATQLDFPDGRRIWVPPTGQPYWVIYGGTQFLTDQEIEKYLMRASPSQADR